MEPSFRTETPESPEATRARRAARLTRHRKKADLESGEGVDHFNTLCFSPSQRTDGQQNTMIIDQEPAQMKAMTKMQNEEKAQGMRKAEKLKREEVESISFSTTSFQEGCTTDLKQLISKLENSLEMANNEVVSGQTTIMILEGEKEKLKDQIEKMKKEKKVIYPEHCKTVSLNQSCLDKEVLVFAEEKYKKLSEERDKAIREAANLKIELENTPSTSFQGTVIDLKYEIKKLEKKLEDANDDALTRESTIMLLEGEKEELKEQFEQMKKEKKKLQNNTRETGDTLEQLQEILSEVGSIIGLSENESPQDLVLKLSQAWQRHESRYQKLRDRLEGIAERKRAAYANTQLLREAVEKLFDVEPGTLEISDLVEKIQDIDQYYALKIDNINAKLEAKQQSSKEKLKNIREICRATATEMDIKFKKKTKIPEFLALFSSVLNKQQGLVTSLDKKLLENDCRIEELESALNQMKKELEQASTSKEIKKKKKRLLRTIINTMVPKQSSDGKLDKLKHQADQIRRLEAIQESKYRQDHEVLALHRETTALKQTKDDLQKKQKELEEVNVELNHRLDHERRTVKELRKTIQILEEGNRQSFGEVLQHEVTQHMQSED